MLARGCVFRWLLVLFGLWPALVTGVVEVSPSTKELPIWPQLEVLEDPSAELGPEEIANTTADQWRGMDHPHTHFGIGHSAYWARFELNVQVPREADWYLVHAQSFVDDVRLFLRKPGEDWQKIVGLRDENAGWFGGARNPAFVLRLEPGATYELMVRTQTLSLRRFPLQLFNEETFHRRERISYVLIGGVVAIPLVVSVFMLLLWQIQRDRGLLIILALILSELVGAMYVGGVLTVVLPWLSPRTLGLIGLGGWVTAISFAHVHARYFLQLDRDASRLARVFRWAPRVIVPCFLLEFMGWPVGRNVLILIALTSAAAFFAASIWQARRRFPYAWVYAAAWGTYLLSTVVIAVNLLSTIPPNVSNLAMFAQGSVVSLIFAIAVVGQMRDRESRTQAELAASNRRFELAASGAEVGLFDWDPQNQRLFLSVRGAELLGTVPGPVKGRAFLRSLPRQVRRPLLNWQRQLAAAQGRGRILELLLHERPLILSGSAVLHENDVVRIAGSVSDASQLRALEESRAQNRLLEDFRLLFDNASVGLYRADSNASLLRANALIGKWQHSDRVAWHADPNTYDTLIERLRTEGGVTSYEYDALVDGDTEPRRFSESARLDFVDGDNRLVYEGAIQDITERYRIEQELIAANERVRAAMADRSRFFAATNHDLRQPLQSLGLLLELMRDQSMSTQMQDWVNRMSLAYASLADTLDGLMELARMEAGNIEINLERISLQPLLEQLAHEYGLLAERKNLVLSAPRTSLSVYSDRRLLERILRNLLANAVRHTRSGRLLMGCRRRGEFVGVQVVDTGPGIADSERERLFRPFAQGEDHPGEGLGLGLSIVNGLVSTLGHELCVSSGLGRGSCFELRLPKAGSPSHKAIGKSGPYRKTPLAGRRIYVVDDQQEVAHAIAASLRTAGAVVHFASEPHEALTWSLEPDGLILDYHLGMGISGVQLRTALEQRFGSSIPTVFISGDTQSISADVKQSATVLRKPVTSVRLIDALLSNLKESVQPHSEREQQT